MAHGKVIYDKIPGKSSLSQASLVQFQMTEDKSLIEQVDMFNKLILDLENIDVNIDDEDQAVMLPSSLPKSYTHFKETLIYGRESLTFEEVQDAINAKDLNERKEKKSSLIGKGLSMKGKPSEKDHKNDKKKGKLQQKASSGNVPNIRCYSCKKEGRSYKKDISRNDDKNKDGNAVIAQDGYESADTEGQTSPFLRSCVNKTLELCFL